jgi:hypothetical protein
MVNGLTGEQLFHAIETSGSFSGSMRKTLVSMLDGIGLNQYLGLLSCSELFGAASALVHFTSAVSAPSFIDGKNFTGHGVSFLKLPKFRAFIVDNLAKELTLLPSAVIIPLGKIVDEIIEFLRVEKLIDPARCLIGFPQRIPAQTPFGRDSGGHAQEPRTISRARQLRGSHAVQRRKKSSIRLRSRR